MISFAAAIIGIGLNRPPLAGVGVLGFFGFWVAATRIGERVS